MVKVSLGGEKLFVEFEFATAILNIHLIENISHDGNGSIFMYGMDFNHSIMCDRLNVETQIPEPDIDLMHKVFKEINILLKEFHSNKKSANSKAYIK